MNYFRKEILRDEILIIICHVLVYEIW